MIKFFTCSCHCNDHLIRAEVDNLEDCPMLSVSVGLCHVNIFKRIWSAVKYVLRIGQPVFFDDFLFSQETCKEMMDVCSCYLELTAGKQYWDEQFKNLSVDVDGVDDVQDVVMAIRKTPTMLKYVDMAIDLMRKSGTKIIMRWDNEIIIQCDINISGILDLTDNVSNHIFNVMTSDQVDVNANRFLIHAQ